MIAGLGTGEEKEDLDAVKEAMGGGLVGEHPSQSDPVSNIPEGVDWFSNLQNQVFNQKYKTLLVLTYTFTWPEFSNPEIVALMM